MLGPGDPQVLDGRHALVTGAARGIGLAVARKMLECSASVTIADIDGDALNDCKEELPEHGDRLLICQADVSDPLSVEHCAKFVADTFGGLDILVNNAAILDTSTAAEITEKDWQRVLDVNLTGALRMTQACLPWLRQARHGSIVNTTSTQALMGQPASVAYATAKAGLMNLTRAMAVDLGEDGIRVNAVAPGFINTRMAIMPDGGHEHEQAMFKQFYLDQGRIPLRRAGTPDDCAGAFVFLASDMSLYVTGQTIIVDGGLCATY